MDLTFFFISELLEGYQALQSLRNQFTASQEVESPFSWGGLNPFITVTMDWVMKQAGDVTK